MNILHTDDVCLTYLTDGASAASGTAPKPAALTAMPWSNPKRNRRPNGIASITGFPISNIIKKNQSVVLGVPQYSARWIGRRSLTLALLQ